jgi:hypothetical protein
MDLMLQKFRFWSELTCCAHSFAPSGKACCSILKARTRSILRKLTNRGGGGMKPTRAAYWSTGAPPFANETTFERALLLKYASQ